MRYKFFLFFRYAQVCTALSDYPAAITAYDRVTELLKNQKLHSLHLLASKGSSIQPLIILFFSLISLQD